MTRACAAALIATAAVFATAAQAPVPAPGPLVVDFTARGTDGAPVLDLQASDVVIRVGATRRPVRSLQLVRLGAAGETALAPPFASNEAPVARARTVIIVFDNESMRPGREPSMRRAVQQLLDGLSPSDRVSVATVPLGGVLLDLTTNHHRARDVFNRLDGRAPRTLSAHDFACRSRRTLETLAALLGKLGGGRGPTSVVFITSSLSGLTRDAPRTSLGAGMCEIVAETFEAVAVAAAGARAQFYVVQPEDEMVTPGSVTPGDLAGSTIAELGAGVNHLAGVTGAEVLRLGGAAATSVARILGDTSAYYAATIDADASDRGVARLEVVATRPGVTVRSRPRIAIVGGAAAGRASPVTPRGMLREPRAYDELPVRAAAYVSSQPGESRLRTIVVTETDPGTTLTAAAIGVFDASGKLVAQWTARADELTGPSVMAALLVAPGRYRLRVAAVDAAGRAGTVDHDLDAGLHAAGAVALSDAVLGVEARGAFRPRLLFRGDEIVVAQVEMTGVPKGARPEGRLEIARTLNGPALVSAAAAVGPAGDSGRATVVGRIALPALTAGDYAVRVIVTTGDASARVVRTIRVVN